MCDSLTSSSSSCSNSHKIPLRKIKLKNPTIPYKSLSKNNVDQCLQTSINLSDVTHSKSTDRILNNHPSQSSFISHHSLPDLDFLTHYAKENPPQLTTRTNQTKDICTAMRSTLSDPLSLTKKPVHTIFYCSIKLPNNPLIVHPTLSSECSSTSSSGYFSNCSTNQTRPIRIPLSQYPLKSCLKRAKTEELTKANVLAVGIAGDIFTLASGLGQNKNEGLTERRSSAPTTPSHQQNVSLQFRPRNQTCTLSEHDLRAKKSVSFCNEIARRLITPSPSPKHRYQGMQFLLCHFYTYYVFRFL
jgi:hypothetical protein